MTKSEAKEVEELIRTVKAVAYDLQGCLRVRLLDAIEAYRGDGE